MQKSRLSIVITWFEYVLDFGRYNGLTLSYAVLRILRETLLRRDMPGSRVVCQEKKFFFFLPTEVFFFLPTVNACLSLTSLKACDWSGHIFGAILAPVPFYGGA